jgi:hypothetical protein
VVTKQLVRSTNTRVLLYGEPDQGKTQSVEAVLKTVRPDAGLNPNVRFVADVIGRDWEADHFEKIFGQVC